MCYTAKEFADINNISSRKIGPWFDAGYLGNTTKDPKTQIYSIPKDTPVPFNADPRIKQQSSLWKEILEAAELGQAIYPTMYPKRSEEFVQKQINGLLNDGCINIHKTQSGAPYLEITRKGYDLLTSLKEPAQKRAWDRVVAGISISCTVVQTLIAALPELAALISKIPPQ